MGRFVSMPSDCSQRKFLQANILRLAGIYGPGRLVGRIEGPSRRSKVPQGNADAWLNLIHVDDAVAAVLACHRRGTPGAYTMSATMIPAGGVITIHSWPR